MSCPDGTQPDARGLCSDGLAPGAPRNGATTDNSDCVPADLNSLLIFEVEDTDFNPDVPLNPVEKCKECCKDKEEKWGEACKKLHRAVAERLKAKGCPAVIRPYKKSSKSCSARKKKPCAKKRSSKSGCRTCRK